MEGELITSMMTSKSFKQLKKWQIIEISWIDSVHTNGWTFEDSARLDDKFLRHKTIGYYFKETKLGLSVIQSKSDDGEDKANVDAIMTIPKVAVKKIKKI